MRVAEDCEPLASTGSLSRLEAAMAGMVVAFSKEQRRKGKPLTVTSAVKLLRSQARTVPIRGRRMDPADALALEQGADWLNDLQKAVEQD